MNDKLNEKITESLESLLAEINDSATKAEETYATAKKNALTDLENGDPTYALKYRMEPLLEAQTKMLCRLEIQKLVEPVTSLAQVDDFTKLFLLRERLQKLVSRVQGNLTVGFRIPSSSSHLDRAAESIVMETKFKFYFGDFSEGAERLAYHFEREFDSIEKLAKAENLEMPKPQLAERCPMSRKWQQNDSMFVEVDSLSGFVRVTLSVSDLEKAVYRFDVNNAYCTVRLSHFSKETRESRRKQNWNRIPVWDGEVRSVRGVPNNPAEGRQELYLDSHVEEMALRGAAMITGVRPVEVG